MKEIDKEEAFKFMSPLPYVVVTSLDKTNRPNMLGVAWVTRTSWDPFLILISIDHKRYSHEGIKLHKEFVVNYPSKDQMNMAWLAGTKSGRNIDKIKEGNVEMVNSVAVRIPTIKNVTVAFECKTKAEYITGDHTIFIGEVVATTGNPDKNSTLFCNNKYQLIAFDSLGVLQE